MKKTMLLAFLSICFSSVGQAAQCDPVDRTFRKANLILKSVDTCQAEAFEAIGLVEYTAAEQAADKDASQKAANDHADAIKHISDSVDEFLAKRADAKKALVEQDNVILSSFKLASITENDVTVSDAALRKALIAKNDPGAPTFPNLTKFSNLLGRSSGFGFGNNARYCLESKRLIVTVHDEYPSKANLLLSLGFVQDCRDVDTTGFANLPAQAGSKNPYDFFTVRKNSDGSYTRGDL